MNVFLEGEIYLNVANTSGKEKFMKYITNNIWSAIDEIGPSNVVDLVMDNVDVCRWVRCLIEKKCPHVVFNACSVHVWILFKKTLVS